ncbi:MAG: hypothetical protein K2I70_04365 [Bacilli bacterium]|nr:hypothetical protein [Bacilli bacterium]
MNTVSMNLPVEIPNNTNTIFINVKINGRDRSWVYPMILGSNAVGRAFKLYLGIVEQSNYDDAIKLINAEKFNMGFAYEDYEDGVESVNKIIEDLAGSPTVSYQREYSIEVRNIVNKYYNHVKNNPFLFDEYAQASSDKKRQLEKNAYIKQILLSNRD